jgi:ubiquitin-conjugating enzyme E2 D/E
MAARIPREFQDLKTNPLAQLQADDVELVDESLTHWKLTFSNLGAPYEGGRFAVHVEFTAEYPFKAPKMSLGTQIYHPNFATVAAGGGGGAVKIPMCMDILNDWSPARKMRTVVETVVSIMLHPETEHPGNADAAAAFADNNAAFRKTAQEWTNSECA